MPTSPRTWTRLLALAALLFAILNTFNALNKGGDAAVFFEGGRRFLNAEPLYEGSSTAAGFIGPPFQAMFFAPFAALLSINPTAAKIAWHLVGVACLAAGVWFSAQAWQAARVDIGLPVRKFVPWVFAPLVAALLPVQTNFEHQNLNPLLLALVAGGTLLLTRASWIAAGALIGTAAALKAFPALLIGYLLLRSRRAAFPALATAVVLSLLPAVVYGIDGLITQLGEFGRLASGGWPVRGNNQSLIASIDRLVNGVSSEGVRQADGTVAIIYGVAAATLLVSAMFTSLTWREPERPTMVVEVAAVLTLSVLLSPIAWDHYWMLLVPALMILFDSRDQRLLRAWGAWAFGTVALLITGVSPLTVGRRGFNVARELSAYTIAGVIAYVALLAVCWRIQKMRRTAGVRDVSA